MRWGELTCVFFFKQKTAYEMRISDWSSDGCSSDLHERGEQLAAVVVRERHERPHQQELQLLRVGQAGEQVVRVDPGLAGRDDVAGGISRLGALRSAGGAGFAGHVPAVVAAVEFLGSDDEVSGPPFRLHPEKVLRVTQGIR